MNIFVAGHKGMVGSSILRALKKRGYKRIITKNKKDLNLLDQNRTYKFLKKNKISTIYIASAKVGGIMANKNYPAEFLYENSMIALNLIHNAWKLGIKKILFLGSSCIYPVKNSILNEEDLLTGKVHPTNEAYAISKILGLKLCETYSNQYFKKNGTDYRALMPCNLFGPGDRYDEKNGHVIASLILKFKKAKKNNLKEVTVWGTGRPKREFMYVDDLADVAIKVMNMSKKKFDTITGKNSNFFNVGYGKHYSISEIAKIIKDTIGFKGNIKFDKNYPDGTYQKLMNSRKINKIGWKPKREFKKYLKKITLSAYNDNKIN